MFLSLIIPTFNEAEALPGVIAEWDIALSQNILSGAYEILVINDGSTDNTLETLKILQDHYPKLRVHSHSNRGHGQSCLEGYRLAGKSTFVMQIDSDGQCDPTYFPIFWNRKMNCPLYGKREQRDDGLARKFISLCLRWVLYVSTKTKLHDSNVPYRLYPGDMAAKYADEVPPDFDLGNIAIALKMEKEGFIEIPIGFRRRKGGRASVRWSGFYKKALQLVKDLKSL